MRTGGWEYVCGGWGERGSGRRGRRESWTLTLALGTWPGEHSGCSNTSFIAVRSLSHASLQPYGLQHARLSCSSPSPRACLNSCPLSRWSHPTISSSVVPFSSCLQSFPASGSFQMSWLFASGGQSTRTSASSSFFQWIFRTDFL